MDIEWTNDIIFEVDNVEDEARALEKKGDDRGAWMVRVPVYVEAATRIRAGLREGKGSLFGLRWISWVAYWLTAYYAAIKVYNRRLTHPLTATEWCTVMPLLTWPILGPLSDPYMLERVVEDATAMRDCRRTEAAFMWIHLAVRWARCHAPERARVTINKAPTVFYGEGVT